MSKSFRPFHRKIRGLMITRLLARDGGDCSLCLKPLDRSIRDFRHDEYITFDHIRPVSKGGNDHHTNLRLAHARCNQRRGADWDPAWVPGTAPVGVQP